MYSSPFSYNITRPYPYRWCTWVIVIGGIAATAFFTTINLVATGYDPSILYCTNPNETEHPSDPKWFQKRPWSWASKIVSTCQDQTITMGSQIYTTNLAFAYTVVGLQTTVQNRFQQVSSLAYHNAPLQNCSIEQIVFDAMPDLMSRGPVPVSVIINCTVHAASVPSTVLMTLSTAHDLSHGEVTYQWSPSDWLNVLNPVKQPSLFLGQLLARSYLDLVYENAGNARGSWSFSSSSGNVLEKNASSFIEYYTHGKNLSILQQYQSSVDMGTWTTVLGEELWQDMMPVAASISIPNTWTGMLTGHMVYPPLILDNLAKCLHSLVLADLGQSVKADIFASPQRTVQFFNQTTRIQNLSSNPMDMWVAVLKATSAFNFNSSVDATDFYAWASTGIPQVDLTMISLPYLCQVPKLKPVGTLIISILVADLVFLQALWTLLNWAITTLLERRHSDARYCLACSQQTDGPVTDEHAVSLPIARYNPISSLTFENELPPLQSTQHIPQNNGSLLDHRLGLRNDSEFTGRPLSSSQPYSFI